MKCDICGKEAKTWGHCVCLECYTTPKAKDKQLAIYKRALELACVDVGTIAIITKILKDNEVRATSEDVINYYLDQAKKELEGQDVKD